MKTKHFTSVVPPSTEKTIRLPLPAIEVRERSPFKKYRRNVVEIETTPDERLPFARIRLDLRIQLSCSCDKFPSRDRGLFYVGAAAAVEPMLQVVIVQFDPQLRPEIEQLPAAPGGHEHSDDLIGEGTPELPELIPQLECYGSRRPT